MTAAKRIPGGVHCVLLTPLREGGGIDENSFSFTVRRLIEKKIAGLVVLGSTGELPYLTLDEKKKAIDAVTEAAAGKAPVIVGAGAFGTDETLEIARHAEKQRAHALLAPLPIYFELKFDSVFAHYRRIADEVSLPIIYYHFPETTRLDLDAAQIEKLFSIENMAGIKESTFNLNSIKKHIAALPKTAAVFSGTILMMRPVIAAGGDGCICPIPTLVPEMGVRFHEALKSGKRSAALETEKKLFELLPIFADLPLPAATARKVILTGSKLGLPLKMGGTPHAALKEALRLLGHPISPLVKSPLPPLTEKQTKKVHQTLKKLNLIA